MIEGYDMGDKAKGINVWTIGEFNSIELLGLDPTRGRDPATGFELLSDS
ncbi:MAG: hypothetical protein Q7U56_11440 [Humidesulfovibrio sp.]|nr:hypothetical protein [Humidesulfovibrio sp.]